MMVSIGFDWGKNTNLIKLSRKFFGAIVFDYQT